MAPGPSVEPVFNASLDGLLTGLSLIIAIGAQNAYVLRQGLRRAYVGRVVAVCTVSDFALIIAGVSGIGVIVQHAGWALNAVRWFGVAFLAWYGLSSAWRARHPAALAAAGGEPARGASCCAGSWRSPGSTRTSTSTPWSCSARSRTRTAARGGGGSPSARAWRARCGSPASASAHGSPPGLLATPRAWQVLDLLIAATMLGIAVKLATG